jgi:hypothetical protein
MKIYYVIMTYAFYSDPPFFHFDEPCNFVLILLSRVSHICHSSLLSVAYLDRREKSYNRAHMQLYKISPACRPFEMTINVDSVIMTHPLVIQSLPLVAYLDLPLSFRTYLRNLIKPMKKND